MRRLLSKGSQNIPYSIERISTPSLASMSEGESSEHCTTWIWYWKEGNNDWLQYNVKVCDGLYTLLQWLYDCKFFRRLLT